MLPPPRPTDLPWGLRQLVVGRSPAAPSPRFLVRQIGRWADHRELQGCALHRAPRFLRRGELEEPFQTRKAF